MTMDWRLTAAFVVATMAGVTGSGPAVARAQSRPRFLSPASLPPSRGYSQLVEVPPGQRLIFISGQVALDRQGRLIGPGNFERQAEQVFANLETALREAGATFADVVKLTYYVTDTAHVPALRAVRDRHLTNAGPPASTLVEVSHLFRGDLMLEVEAVAVVGP
jgi:enamine deaminase RidA (YjgF/YER057c/UK114 family)